MNPSLPDHWVCDVCGLRFLMDFEPTVRCTYRHPDGECCHAGEKVLCADGSLQWAAPTIRCLLVST